MEPITRINPWGIKHAVSKEVNITDKNPVKYVEFNLTGRCDGGCISCPTTTFYPDEKGKKTVEDIEREYNSFLKMLEKLKSMGMEFLTIYGREPTLWDRETEKETGEPNYFLRKLIDTVSKDLKVRVCLGTSGMHVNAPLLRTLYDNRGILFMKNWGSADSVEKLMKAKNAFRNIRAGWDLVDRIRKEYKKATTVAEFLYTAYNRHNMSGFWKWACKNSILPQIEVPVIIGDCVENIGVLQVGTLTYIRDIYELSILNLSLKYNIPIEEARDSDIWEPPLGSKFPMACDRLTKTKSIFLERNGNMNVCSGVPMPLGNINDENIVVKIKNNDLLGKVRNAYNNLKGACRDCYYGKEMHVCYGCRGNALSYYKDRNDVLEEDPMCFGTVSVRAEKSKLEKFIAEKHLEKILTYFK